MESGMRIPESIDLGQHRESTIYFLKTTLDEHNEMIAEDKPLLSGPADRYVCGFAIPEFQRPLVWTRKQEIAFIESVWLGLPIGTYTVHEMDWGPGGKPYRFSGMLIDGQQRLTTLSRYWQDEFPVFGLFWSDLNKTEHRRFYGAKFPHFEISLWNEDKIRDLYDRMAFGGTPHKEHQRASQ